MRTPHAAALCLLAALVSGAGPAVSADGPGYRVIVNAANPVAELDRSFVEEAFLKKVVHWPNDETIRPVDLLPGSTTRRAFSEGVLHRSVDAVKGYWQQRIFSGRDVPPPELDTDDDVVKYVLKYEGAVGYVSAGTPAAGTKTVLVR